MAEMKDEADDLRLEGERFYALVGHCILRFQHVEDYLEDVFAAVLGGKRERADAIFASARGIDRKIQIVRAAAIGLSGQPWDNLSSILDRVKLASNVRGQMAHASPVYHGGTVQIQISRKDDGWKSFDSKRLEEPRWELHKRGKTVTVFKTEDLLNEYEATDQLFLNMIDFVKSATVMAI